MRDAAQVKDHAIGGPDSTVGGREVILILHIHLMVNNTNNQRDSQKMTDYPIRNHTGSR
jgi:hypothetical protein